MASIPSDSKGLAAPILGRRPGPQQHSAVLFRAGVEIQAGVLRTDIDVPERALQRTRRVHRVRTGTAEEPSHSCRASPRLITDTDYCDAWSRADSCRQTSAGYRPPATPARTPHAPPRPC